MTASALLAPTWKLQGTTAQFAVDGWQGSVDLELPGRGVCIQCDAQPNAQHLSVLGIEVAHSSGSPGELVDAYVRETDLVAVYREQPGQPLGVQIYWSLARVTDLDGPRLQIDLQVSIQTQQLGVAARAVATSRVAATDAWTIELSATEQLHPLGEIAERSTVLLAVDHYLPCVAMSVGGATAARPNTGAACPSYFEAVQPSDFLGSEVSNEQGWLALRHLLLDETMEKGVIRRLRLRGVCWRRPPTASQVAAWYEEFAAAKPRLTT